MSPKGLQRYLVLYSAVVTLVFMVTVYLGFVRPRQSASKIAEFDRIRAHRIDLVEPDGTVRLVLSDRAAYPGSFLHGKEVARPDRADSAGMLFINDEGTEDGGLIFGGKVENGKPTSFGHLSFDQYDQDQTLSLDSTLVDGRKSVALTLNDMPDYSLTPAIMAAYERVKAMPRGPERAAAWAAVLKKYPPGEQRASLARAPDGSVGLTLADASGHPRLRIRVAADGAPSIDLLGPDGTLLKSFSSK